MITGTEYQSSEQAKALINWPSDQISGIFTPTAYIFDRSISIFDKLQLLL